MHTLDLKDKLIKMGKISILKAGDPRYIPKIWQIKDIMAVGSCI